MLTFTDLSTLITLLKKAIGGKIKSEYYMTSFNSIPLVWNKLSILSYELTKQYPQTITSTQLPVDIEAKILRTIFKNIRDFRNDPLKSVIQFLNKKYSSQDIFKLYLFFKKNNVLNANHITEILQKKFYKNIQYLPTTNLTLATLTTDNHDFNYLLGNIKNAYLINDKNKFDRLNEAIEKPYWFTESIIDDSDMLYIALGACREGIINSRQFATLSQWVELKKRYKNCVTVHPLLDANKKLTSEAKNYFVDCIINRKIDGFDQVLLDDDNLNKLINNFAKLSPVEGVLFRLANLSTQYIEDLEFEFRAGFEVAIFDGTNNEYTGLSTSAYQKFINTCFPSNPIKLLPRLGHVSITDIEQSVRHFCRIISTYYLHPKHINCNNPRFFHKHIAKTTTVIAWHDMWHGLVMSSSIRMHPMLFHGLDTIRAHLGIKWSTGLWRLCDYLFMGKQFQFDDDTILLLNAIKLSYDADLFSNDLAFSPEIAVLFLDIIFHATQWQEYRISPEQLYKCLKTPNFLLDYKNYNYFKWIKSSLFNEQDGILFNLYKIAFIFFNFGIISNNKLETFIKEIDNKKNTIRPKLKIEIPKTVEEGTGKRFARLFWEGKPITEKSFHDLIIPIEETMQICSI